MIITNNDLPPEAGGSATKPPFSQLDTPDGSSVQVELSQLPRRIMKLANEFMEKHYILKLESLRTMARRCCTNVSKSDVDNAIDSLVFNRFLVDGKARTREGLLDNENRRVLYDLVCKQPAIHISKLKELTGMNFRSVQWHLNSLEEFQLVRSVNYGKIRVFFDFHLEKTNDLLHFYMHKDGCLTIFTYLLTHPGAQVGELATQLNMPHSTVSRIAKVLVEEGFLEVLMKEDQALGITIRENVKVAVYNRIYSPIISKP